MMALRSPCMPCVPTAWPTAAGMLVAAWAVAAQAAAAGLRAMADLLPAAATVLGVGVVVKAISVPQRLADVVRSHAWMHAAEGMLYREAVLAAARQCGWQAHAVDVTSLPVAEQQLDSIARAAGRPWRRIEKDAARAAVALLP
jgi:hypothetical protein